MARFLRFQQVKHKSGQSKASIYRGMKEGTFPRAYRIGPRSVAWLEDEIEQWIESRIKGSDGDKSAGAKISRRAPQSTAHNSCAA